MEIVFNSSATLHRPPSHKKKDKDEKIVRKTLVKVWTDLLVQYARPGVKIPGLHELRKELLQKGIDASVIASHWFVFDWMVRDEIETKVKEGLDQCDLAEFIEDVKAAQNDPALLLKLKEDIQFYVMADFLHSH